MLYEKCLRVFFLQTVKKNTVRSQLMEKHSPESHIQNLNQILRVAILGSVSHEHERGHKVLTYLERLTCMHNQDALI